MPVGHHSKLLFRMTVRICDIVFECFIYCLWCILLHKYTSSATCGTHIWVCLPCIPCFYERNDNPRLMQIIHYVGPMHEYVENEYPFLGDTTANQALLFSPAFDPPETIHPTYPNYTLPPANLSFPTGPTSPPNYTLIILPTLSSSLSSVPRTACALSGVRARDVLHQGGAQSEGLWLKDQNGWRWQWLVDGLTPATNYTVLAMQDRKKVSSSINFVTKSGMSWFILKIV